MRILPDESKRTKRESSLHHVHRTKGAKKELVEQISFEEAVNRIKEGQQEFAIAIADAEVALASAMLLKQEIASRQISAESQ